MSGLYGLVVTTKAQIRQSLLAAAKQRQYDPVALANAILQQPAVKQAKRIGVYMALPSEPGLAQFIDMVSVPLALPVYDADANRYVFRAFVPSQTGLVRGKDGCLAPGMESPLVAQLDAILVPCVAVDKQGNRLGRGRGVYDQLLADHPTVAIGVVYPQHVLDRLPVEPHDQPVHAVVLAK